MNFAIIILKLIHLFCKCDQVINLWNNISQWINNKININVIFDDELIILGPKKLSPHQIPLNFVILITKSYIFWCSRIKKNFNLEELKQTITKSYDIHHQIAQSHFKEQNFNKIWDSWKGLFEN